MKDYIVFATDKNGFYAVKAPTMAAAAKEFSSCISARKSKYKGNVCVVRGTICNGRPEEIRSLCKWYACE